MKRRIVVFVFVCLFNLVLVNGINYVNSLIGENNFLIRLNDEPKNENNNVDIPVEEEEKNEYNGEDASKITTKLEKYLKKTELEGYASHIVSSSIKRNVNPYLIAGIIMENTNCKVECSIIVKSCKNVGSLKGSPGCFGGKYKKYDYLEDSIDDLIDYIYDKFISNELTTPNAIYKKYGKDSSWAYKVSNYMDKIKRTK